MTCSMFDYSLIVILVKNNVFSVNKEVYEENTSSNIDT